MSGTSRLRFLLAYGSVSVAATAFVFAVNSTSDRLSGGVAAAALETLIGVSFMGCGMLVRLRRPENNTGRLLFATGLFWDIGTLTSANNAVIYTVGGVLGAMEIAVFAHLLLAYPSGRLRSRFERWLLAAGYTLALVANLAESSVDPSPHCVTCPTNDLFVTASPGTASVINVATDILAVALLVAVGAVMMQHWRAASTAARRGLGSILATGGGALLLIAISFAADPVSSGLRNVLTNLGLLMFAAVPFVVVAVLLRSRLARGGLADLLVDVTDASSVAAFEEWLQRVLGDPSVRLAVWFLERNVFIGGDGEPFEAGDVCSAERVAVGFEDELGRPLALVEHDPALLEEPELLEAALAGARLALQRSRLQWELNMQLAELKRSRARLVEAADTERRRLERNLHDGAQQRLVSLSLALRLAQAKLRSDPDTTEQLLTGAAQELQLALQELRELARGLHPAILADRGLDAALDSLAERSPVPVELSVNCADRLSEAVEVAAFYVASEALANVVKYAQATCAHITVTKTDAMLELEVVDDGIGGADPAAGSGLRGLVDRVDALDGRLEVVSPAGGGTRVRALLPLLVHSPE